MGDIGKKENVRYAEQIILYAQKGKEAANIMDRFRRGIDYLRGDHKIKTRSKTKGNQVYNKLAEVFENRMAHLTDAKPKWIFRPQENNDIFIAAALNQILGDVIWDFIEWEDKSSDSVWQAGMAGASWIKTSLDTSLGWPNFHVIPTNAAFPDPAAKKPSEMRFFVHLIAKNVKDIKRQYGVEVSAEAGLEWLDSRNANYHNPHYTAESVNQTMDNVPFLKNLTAEGMVDFGPDAIGKAIIAEVWVEDKKLVKIKYDEAETDAENEAFRNFQSVEVSTLEHHPKHIEAHQRFITTLDPEAEGDVIQLIQRHIEFHQIMPQETTQRKYPYGRLITVCQGQELRDEPNPLAPVHWRDIFIGWQYFKDMESIWGKSMVQDLFDPQDAFNHRWNSIQMNINLMNNGIRKMKHGIFNAMKGNLRKLNNLIGNTIVVNDENDFTVDFGKPLPPQFFQDLGTLEQFMERISFNEDVTSGRLPSAGTAGVTVSQLLGEARVGLRSVLRRYAGALRKMGENAIALMVEYMPEDERFEILGGDGKYVPIEWGQIKDAASRIKNIRIDTANMLPTSKLERFRKALELKQAGVYDNMAVLEELDDPKKFEVAERLSEIQQLMGALEQSEQKNQDLEKELNTVMNRLQSETGQGNVGVA